MEGDGIGRLKKLFHALVAVLTLLQCVNSSLALGSNNNSSGGVMRCIEREREALLAFKQDLVDDYNVLSSWGREEHKQDCCKWVGVHCSNRTNHVAQLNLGLERLGQAYSLQQNGDPQEIKYYLQGKKMNPKLIELQHLKYLDLSEINFHGAQLPDFVGVLSNLRHLDLSYASFGGRVPSQVGNLTHLKFLDLSYNAFASLENLNSWLPLLSSLTYLDLSFINLRTVPDWLEIVNNHPKLTNLTLVGCGLSSPPNLSSTLFNMNSSKSLAHVDLSNNQLTYPSIFLWLSNYNASLVYLDLSYNSLAGSIPHVFGNMSSLVGLYLYSNQIEGGIPQSFSRLCNLQELYLTNNTLSGQLSWLVQILMSTCPNQNSLDILILSDNHLSGSIPNLTNFSSLNELDLSENQLRGTIPESIGQMSNLEYIRLGRNALEGVVSENHFSNLSRLTILGLSSNSLALSFSSNWVPPFQLDFINLGSCKMGPDFPKWIQTQDASHLYLYNNKISGSISILCEVYKGLMVLDLSSNNLFGELPECLTQLSNLVILDLSYNAFSGKIPATVGSLYHMRSLTLRSNKFVGELPLSFKNCTSLQVIDVGYNKLSGRIPKWLGVSLKNLVVLMLSSNNFNGSMPSELCRLTNIQNLDVSMNNISGTIPNCLSTLTVVAQKGNLSPNCQYQINDTLADTMANAASEYKNTLGVKRIDFSSNRLKGEIPSEITDLVGLVSVNLSRNKLTGELPAEIGNLQSLDAFDLSTNQINGGIPTSLAKIDGLRVLYLSYNNFIGEIPTGKLQSFDHSVYAGNPQLCGPPLQNMCGDDDEKNEPRTWGFYVSIGLGFIVGFWGVFGSLIFVKSWRYSYFRFLNVLNDWFYVKVVSIKRRFN